MQDYQASIEKLRRDASEAALIRDLSTDKLKRETYRHLHDHLTRLADEVEHAMNAAKRVKAALFVGLWRLCVCAQACPSNVSTTITPTNAERANAHRVNCA